MGTDFDGEGATADGRGFKGSLLLCFHPCSSV